MSAALKPLPFAIGAQVRVVSGELAGTMGQVTYDWPACNRNLWWPHVWFGVTCSRFVKNGKESKPPSFEIHVLGSDLREVSA